MMSMWLSLLGPLHVESNGIARKVTAGKHRALLAALAVNANNVVHTDQLVEAIWGALPPPSKEQTIRTYASRLRECLGQDAAERVETNSSGYILRVDRAELDLLMFESLVREGRAGFEAGDWPGCAARLSEAEALWRGTPLADVPMHGQHDRHLSYLEQTRLTALELRIEAEVRASQHGAACAIPELEMLAAQHPERERLCLLLMLACYRGGRQAEALAAFTKERGYSVEEYGIEPGPELVRMHQRILAQDLTLLAEPLDRPYFT